MVDTKDSTFGDISTGKNLADKIAGGNGVDHTALGEGNHRDGVGELVDHPGFIRSS